MIYRNIKLTKKNYQFLHIFVVFANEEVIIKKRAIYSLRSYRYQSFLDYRMLIHPFCVSNCISHIFFFFNHLSHCNRFHTAFYNLANTFTYYECLAHITTAEPTLSLSLSYVRFLSLSISLSLSLFFNLRYYITIRYYEQ